MAVQPNQKCNRGQEFGLSMRRHRTIHRELRCQISKRARQFTVNFSYICAALSDVTMTDSSK